SCTLPTTSLSRAPPPPTPTLFPYTTLFRSDGGYKCDDAKSGGACGEDVDQYLWIDHYWCIPKAQEPTGFGVVISTGGWSEASPRSEEHTSELQSRSDLVCRLLLEKKKEQAI